MNKITELQRKNILLKLKEQESECIYRIRLYYRADEGQEFRKAVAYNSAFKYAMEIIEMWNKDIEELKGYCNRHSELDGQSAMRFKEDTLLFNKYKARTSVFNYIKYLAEKEGR